MTLVEKLEKELARNCQLNNWDLGFKAAIDIVKQHQAESDWVSVDEYRKNAKVNDRVFVYDTFYEVVMPSLVRVISGRAGFRLTNGWQAMHVSHVCGMTVPQPPSGVQEKIYEQEMDKISFCGCGCILPDGLTRCSDCEALDD